MIIRIKVQVRDTDQHLAQVVVLDSSQYQLDTYNNKYDGRWYLDLHDSLGNPVVRSIGLVAGIDLLYPYRAYAGVPPGKLFVRLTDGQLDDPTLDTFSQGKAVFYYQEALT